MTTTTSKLCSILRRGKMAIPIFTYLFGFQVHAADPSVPPTSKEMEEAIKTFQSNPRDVRVYNVLKYMSAENAQPAIDFLTKYGKPEIGRDDLVQKDVCEAFIAINSPKEKYLETSIRYCWTGAIEYVQFSADKIPALRALARRLNGVDRWRALYLLIRAGSTNPEMITSLADEALKVNSPRLLGATEGLLIKLPPTKESMTALLRVNVSNLRWILIKMGPSVVPILKVVRKDFLQSDTQDDITLALAELVPRDPDNLSYIKTMLKLPPPRNDQTVYKWRDALSAIRVADPDYATVYFRDVLLSSNSFDDEWPILGELERMPPVKGDIGKTLIPLLKSDRLASRLAKYLSRSSDPSVAQTGQARLDQFNEQNKKISTIFKWKLARLYAILALVIVLVWRVGFGFWALFLMYISLGLTIFFVKGIVKFFIPQLLFPSNTFDLAALTTTAIVCLRTLIREWQKKSNIEEVPTSRIESAAQGYVEIYGTAISSDRKLTSRLRKVPCVYSNYSIDRRTHQLALRRWQNVKKGSFPSHFNISDKTGVCRVHLDAVPDLLCQEKTWYGFNADSQDGGPIYRFCAGFFGDYRFRETVISPGENVHVLGWLQTEGSHHSIRKPTDDLGLHFIVGVFPEASLAHHYRKRALWLIMGFLVSASLLGSMFL